MSSLHIGTIFNPLVTSHSASVPSPSTNIDLSQAKVEAQKKKRTRLYDLSAEERNQGKIQGYRGRFQVGRGLDVRGHVNI